MRALPRWGTATSCRSDAGALKGTRPRLVVECPGHLERLYTFKDFAQALAYVNKVGAVAEAEGHHPDLYLAWGKCRVEIWTHKINGLTESDFYMAAKADREFEPFRAAAS